MERPKISDSEFVKRVRKTQELMKQQEIDILLAYGNEAEPQFARYYCDYWPSFESCGVIMGRESEPILLIGPESLTYASDRSRIKDIRRLAAFRESSNPEYPGHILQSFGEILEELTGSGMCRKMAIAGINIMAHFTYAELADAAKGVEIIRGDELVMSLRAVKSEDEIACIKYADKITAQAFDYVIENIKPGMTELQVRGLAVGKMFELGAEDEAYPNWVLCGEGGNQAISRARHKVIEKGDMVHLQFGARYEGYASTIGRPVVVGEPQEWMIRAVNAGYEGYDAVLEQLYAGNNAGNVAKSFYNTMEKNGYSDWLLYGPCHATGLMEGEPPWIEQNSDYELKENMTFCICLFMGNKNGYGFRIEDNIRVAQGRAENMSCYRRGLIIV